MGEEEKAKESHQTRLEAFLAKKGTLLIKDIHSLGTLDGKHGSKIAFEAIVLYEPGQEKGKTRGLKIEVSGGDQFKRQGTSFLDLDEVEDLSKAMHYMVDLSSKWKGTAKEYSEVVFSTKGHFNAGFYQLGQEQGAFASNGIGGGASCFFLSPSDLSSVRNIVEEGLDWLRPQETCTHGADHQKPQRREIGQSPWDTLGVPPSASQDEISTAYHRMAEMYHPDKVAALGPEFKEIAERKMKEINGAYEELKQRQ